MILQLTIPKQEVATGIPSLQSGTFEIVEIETETTLCVQAIGSNSTNGVTEYVFNPDSILLSCTIEDRCTQAFITWHGSPDDGYRWTLVLNFAESSEDTLSYSLEIFVSNLKEVKSFPPPIFPVA